MTSEQLEEIVQLRSRKLSPKQIARKLGLRPAEVTAIIKQQSQEGMINKVLPPFKQCLINTYAMGELLKASNGGQGEEEEGKGGIAQVMLLRVDEQNHYWVSSYLIDYWCLGVKNTFGPQQMSRLQYEELLRQTTERFEQTLSELTLEQAQSIVFGAVDYAASLGFEPHRDFLRSRLHLGPRPDSLLDIDFGRNGKPFFIQGPYDKTEHVLKCLQDSVGDGNFDYLVSI